MHYRNVVRDRVRNDSFRANSTRFVQLFDASGIQRSRERQIRLLPVPRIYATRYTRMKSTDHDHRPGKRETETDAKIESADTRPEGECRYALGVTRRIYRVCRQK